MTHLTPSIPLLPISLLGVLLIASGIIWLLKDDKDNLKWAKNQQLGLTLISAGTTLNVWVAIIHLALNP